MVGCDECGEEVDADDVACRGCGAHQWRRRETPKPVRTNVIRERPVKRRGRGDPGNGRAGFAGLRDRLRPDGAERADGGSGRSDAGADPHSTARPKADRQQPQRADTPTMRAASGRAKARAAEQRRSLVTAVAVTVVAPLCLGLGIVAFGETAFDDDAAGAAAPEWVLVLETASKSGANRDELARDYRGADVVIADGDEHAGLRPGTYSAIPRRAYASQRQAAADCGGYGRTEGAQCRPVRVR